MKLPWRQKPNPMTTLAKRNALAESDQALMDEFVPCLQALLPEKDPVERLRQMRIIWQHVHNTKKRLEVERDEYLERLEQERHA